MADDQFAEIARRDRETSPAELSPIPPREWDQNPLDAYSGSVPHIEKEAYEERRKRFDSNISELRTEYEPFLRELQPAKTVERSQKKVEEFAFRYETEADAANFERVKRGDGDWETVTIPDYRGPEGVWTGFYRTTFEYSAPTEERVYLRFRGVDYLASVYLNGRHIGSHKGVCGEFEFDVTETINTGENTLIVEIQNDYPMKGANGTADAVNVDLTGDKLLAVNSPGWDDPTGGWQCCPAGAGIFHDVILEERPAVHLADVYFTPDLAANGGTVGIDVMNTTQEQMEIELEWTIYPQNFEGEVIEGDTHHPPAAGLGQNEYRFPFQIENYRHWQPDEPWLYTGRVRLIADDEVIDVVDVQFGMREFEVRESSDPSGELRLNGEPIRLRGTGCMGHLQRAVMADDDDRLIRDILIAKYANLNYFRVLQRPVQTEVYEMFDKLGMLAQTDLPLFGQLRRNKVPEAVKQVEEMGRHIRGHPSSVMCSFMNEAFDMVAREQTHRFCTRPELEDFFEAASETINRVNPELEIKYIEGDYNPPTRTGLSDFHTYLMWYTNSPISFGEFHAGWLPDLKADWLTGCGEYGAEGLDNLALMLDRYPEAWLPEELDDPWTPRQLYRQQTYGMHGDWFEEQDTINEWIDASQAHQARAVQFMTDALRRRSDWVVSSALQFLIDAWPSGWMKAVVDASRDPKPAYFAYKDALEPIRIHLRTDRFTYYAGESLDVETWLLNDTGDRLDDYGIEAALRFNGETHGAVSRTDVTIDPASGRYEGHITLSLPACHNPTDVAVEAFLFDQDGNRVNEERLEIEVHPRCDPHEQVIAYKGDQLPEWLSELPLEVAPFSTLENPTSIIIPPAAVEKRDITSLLSELPATATVLCTRLGGHGSSWSVTDETIEVHEKDRGGLTFIARNQTDRLTAQFDSQAFAYLYNEESNRVDFIADTYLTGPVEPILFTYEQEDTSETQLRGEKDRYPIVGRYHCEERTVYFSELLLAGRVGHNPALDRFLVRLLTE